MQNIKIAVTLDTVERERERERERESYSLLKIKNWINKLKDGNIIYLKICNIAVF